MTVLLIFSLSPLLTAILAGSVVLYAKSASLPKPRISFLVWRSLIYAVIGAAVSLGFTLAWMAWYESYTGFSAGKGLLGWALLFGPLSASFGQLVALIDWWFKKGAIAS